MPVDINRLTEGWLELESDPGLFTLLLEDFGVKGVQVEEIYDLQKSIEGPVYGFIFLFRWIEERRSRRKIVDKSESFVKDEDVVNNIFFAQQMVPNSCATHALLSVLLNCPNIHLGATLSRLKAHTSGMSPENKGWAIGNTPELARAHNSHAMPQAKRRMDKSSSVSTGRYTGEAFHFVSYVPIGGKLFELDGLKPFPIDHGPWGDKEDWTEKFRTVITDRLGIASGEQYHDIRFNLMAVVPDKRLAFSHKLKMLKTNRQIVLEALTQLVKLTPPNMSANRLAAEESSARHRKESASVSSEQSVTRTRKRTVSREEEEKVVVGSGAEDVRSCISDKKSWGVPKISIVKSADKSSVVSSYVSPHTILETHNYAKSPLIAGVPESQKNLKVTCANENSSSEVASEDQQMEKNEEKSMSTLCPPDYSTPLTIQTSPAPSNSSTDTSSEVGSAFNSPTQGWGWNSGQSSPTSTKDFKKFVVIRVAGDEDKIGDCHLGRTSTSIGSAYTVKRTSERISGNNEAASKKASAELESSVASKEVERKGDVFPEPSGSSKEEKRVEEYRDVQYADKKVDAKLCAKYPELFEPHTFAPKDLLALLKNLDNEINVCEGSLKDENEKRKKYKIDDCRRTHNYDEFICTFLSMLAQQGKLADLVQQHLLLHKKQGVPIGRLHRGAKKPESRSSNSRRRRGRSKYRKRK
ncbi:ubiquitin carboxyl-terminal hydrolase calypso isoform X1 [Ischnura elegans]|uniref:ubiquitin carboxyl-terminal hydrolase calypso isoform X1 n=1 Tax=Ischnura elegans TaxID=197161 RepID=UPI001ED8AB7C|nr:ubiquitin carboxyl-terminal hydrolase calypso isoform X1 [Ischnura elegans]